jgi:hypothetical protein
MNKRYFQVAALGIDAMHAEPIAALDALKLASLALQSTHSPRYGFPSRAARDDLDSAIARDPCENCGLGAQQVRLRGISPIPD